MKTTLKRREFIAKGSKAGMACCALILCPNIDTLASANFREGEKPDPKKLNYCSYVCPDECVFLKGTLENDEALKKEAYETWKIKDRFGVDFDPEKIFCYGCKTADKPEGIVLKNCTVRSCAIEKGFDCCIECKELTECEKELWDRFPDFKKYVIELQKTYESA